MKPRLVVIDNYDSFTYNLVHAASVAGAEPVVHRNDAIDRNGVVDLEPDGLIFSPGPGHPEKARDFGVCKDLVLDPLDCPILGVCLGMQGLAAHTGAKVVHAPQVVHGLASEARLEKHPLFEGLGETASVGRYHSLVVEAKSLPPAWRIIASAQSIPMAIAHQQHPWFGVQFHPESILTPDGPRLLQNFVEACR